MFDFGTTGQCSLYFYSRTGFNGVTEPGGTGD